MPETDLSECPAPNPLSRPGRYRAMSYPLDNPRKEDPPVPVGPYYFETLNILLAPWNPRILGPFK